MRDVVGLVAVPNTMTIKNWSTARLRNDYWQRPGPGHIIHSPESLRLHPGNGPNSRHIVIIPVHRPAHYWRGAIYGFILREPLTHTIDTGWIRRFVFAFLRLRCRHARDIVRGIGISLRTVDFLGRIFLPLSKSVVQRRLPACVRECLNVRGHRVRQFRWHRLAALHRSTS